MSVPVQLPVVLLAELQLGPSPGSQAPSCPGLCEACPCVLSLIPGTMLASCLCPRPHPRLCPCLSVLVLGLFLPPAFHPGLFPRVLSLTPWLVPAS